MNIKIGYDFEKNKIIENENIDYSNENEKKILSLIISDLKNEFNENDFKIISNTQNYLTLQYKNCDIARIKYTDKSKWISVLIINKEKRKEYMDSELFSSQKNKNQLQWKSELTNDDISKYIDILNSSCKEIKIKE